MREIGFAELYATDFNIKMLAAFNQRWTERQEFEMVLPRKCSALLYFVDCGAEYTFPDGTKLFVKKGDVVYIPQGSVYKTLFLAGENTDAHTQLIEFELKISEESFCISNEVFVAAKDETSGISEIFSETVNIFAMPVLPVSALKSEIYNLLSVIAAKYRHSEFYTKEFKSIAAAVKYIENNSNIEKSVAELAKMCYMSETYFRILFKKCLGISPSEYCTKLKISNAKRLLKSGFYSVGEVSEMLGFKDSGYFNKIFKKHTGVTPGKYR